MGFLELIPEGVILYVTESGGFYWVQKSRTTTLGSIKAGQNAGYPLLVQI